MKITRLIALFAGVLIFGSAAYAQQTYLEFYKSGNTFLQQGNLDSAINAYGECIKLNSSVAGCYQNRALALVEKSKRERRDYVNAVMNYDGVNVKNATRLQALEDANKAIQLNPKTALAYFTRARIYAAEDLYGKAYDDFNQGLTLEPNLATSNAKAYETAKIELAKIEKQYASSLASNGRLAVIRAASLAQLKDEAGAQKIYQEAIEKYTKSLALDKNQYLTWASRGDVYRYTKNYPAAISDYTEAVKFKPDYAEGYVRRAEVYEEQKNRTLALADYEKVLTMPVTVETKYAINNALVGRGKARLNAGQIDAAITDFTKVIADNDNYVMAYFHRGQAYAKKKNKPLAVADFKKALEIAPDYADAKTELRKLGVKL